MLLANFPTAPEGSRAEEVERGRGWTSVREKEKVEKGVAGLS